MPLTLLPILLPDLPRIHTLSLSADSDSPTARVLFPHHASPTSVAHLTQQDERDMQDPRSTSRYVMVCDVPADGAEGVGVGEVSGGRRGEVVSYAMWNFFVESGEDGEGRDGGGAYYDEWPSDVNKEAVETLMASGKRMREQVMGRGDYALLATLCTSPKYRRQGAASQLVAWGLSLADAHYLPSYVESTPSGLSLYLKHGFQKVDTLEHDLRPWGSNHVKENTILVRPPRAPDPSIDSIMLSPILTNRDLATFPIVEEKAFAPKPDPDQPGSEENPDAKPQTPSIFTLIMKDVDTNLHNPLTFRGDALIRNFVTDPTTHYIKAFIPRTNTIIGWIKYSLCLSPSAQQPLHVPWVTGSNTALISTFFGGMDHAREEYFQGKPYLCVQTVVVLAEWQRKGVGKMMLEEVVRRVDKEGVEAWIDASREGKGLYEKFGWREIGEVKVDLGEWGGEKGRWERAVQMVRGGRR
ncbi:hypothetical protein ACLMJK_005587 [Lecanora helva]